MVLSLARIIGIYEQKTDSKPQAWLITESEWYIPAG